MKVTMKCMKLDFMLLKPYVKSILFVLLVPLLFPVLTGSLFEGLSFSVTVMAMTTAYTFSIAEKNSLERFYGFLPVKKNNLVAGRYIAVFTMGYVSIVLEALLQVILLRFVKHVILPVPEVLVSIMVCALLFSIYAGVQIPGYYKYGSIKGKVFMFIPTVGFLVFYYVLKLLGDSGFKAMPESLMQPGTIILSMLILIVFLAFVSFLCSVKIVQKKEEV